MSLLALVADLHAKLKLIEMQVSLVLPMAEQALMEISSATASTQFHTFTRNSQAPTRSNSMKPSLKIQQIDEPIIVIGEAWESQLVSSPKINNISAFDSANILFTEAEDRDAEESSIWRKTTKRFIASLSNMALSDDTSSANNAAAPLSPTGTIKPKNDALVVPGHLMKRNNSNRSILSRLRSVRSTLATESYIIPPEQKQKESGQSFTSSFRETSNASHVNQSGMLPPSPKPIHSNSRHEMTIYSHLHTSPSPNNSGHHVHYSSNDGIFAPLKPPHVGYETLPFARLPRIDTGPSLAASDEADYGGSDGTTSMIEQPVHRMQSDVSIRETDCVSWKQSKSSMKSIMSTTSSESDKLMSLKRAVANTANITANQGAATRARRQSVVVQYLLTPKYNAAGSSASVPSMDAPLQERVEEIEAKNPILELFKVGFNPMSSFCVGWNFMMAVNYVTMIWSIPFKIGFGGTFGMFSKAYSIGLSTTFFLDTLFTLLTKYNHPKLLLTTNAPTLYEWQKLYVRTAFPLDVLTIIPFELLHTEASEYLWLVRCIRIYKLPHVISTSPLFHKMRKRPNTPQEQIIMICFSMIGAALYASIVGTISSFSIGLDVSGRLYKQKIDELKEYMRWKGLDPVTRRKVIKYYEIKYRGKFFEEKTLLSEMNDSLRMEIAAQNCKQLIAKVPFLNRKMHDGRDELFLGRIATALTTSYYVPGDIIISVGDMGFEMFFILKGSVNVMVGGNLVGRLQEGSFFGELALIANIPRTATIQAASTCVMYVLSRKDFEKILPEYEDVRNGLDVIYLERMARVKQEEQLRKGREL
ncbi:Potassium voltage-gated channel sub H member 7 [Chytriomyces hyalinus]|nr:Potassium voltage-gated channel sub H member 7 [Chytriomyces hyalinus]